jgi:hypothetical protein
MTQYALLKAHCSLQFTFLFPMRGLRANSSGWYGNQVSNVQIPGPWGQSEPKEPSKNRDFYIDTFLA